MSMFTVLALDGLPPYGPRATSIPDADAFSEGYVVEFRVESSTPWICNFRRFPGRYSSSIHADFGPRAVVVVASGAGYVVNVEERILSRSLDGPITATWFQPEIGAIVFSTDLWFEAHGPERRLWKSRRVSWDGLKITSHVGLVVEGEASDVQSDQWVPFKLDLATGRVEGGSYPTDLVESES